RRVGSGRARRSRQPAVLALGRGDAGPHRHDALQRVPGDHRDHQLSRPASRRAPADAVRPDRPSRPFAPARDVLPRAGRGGRLQEQREAGRSPPGHRPDRPAAGERMKNEAIIVAGARTPMAVYNTHFKDLPETELGAIAAREAVRRAGVAPARVDHVVFGNAMQTSANALYGARHVGLKAGLPETVPALTVNRLCGSGLQAIATAA